jgi:hypothetical protein
MSNRQSVIAHNTKQKNRVTLVTYSDFIALLTGVAANSETVEGAQKNQHRGRRTSTLPVMDLGAQYGHSINLEVRSEGCGSI